jgi:hypothetical protein
MHLIFLKITAAVACAGLLAIAMGRSWKASDRWHRQFRRFDTLALWLLARIIPIFLVYVVGKFAPQSDVATCFWPQAIGAANGKVPYRDFESFFSPLFPYLLSIPVLLWHDPRALLVWFSILEAMTVHVTARFAGLHEAGSPRLRFLLCAFLAPGPLLLSVIGGQEDFLVWTSGLVIWLVVRRSSDGTASAVATFAALATKATIIVPLALLLGIVRSPLRFLACLVPIGAIAGFVLWRLTGTQFLSVLSQSGNISPPQIWLLLHFLSHGIITAGTSAISFVVVIGIVGIAFIFGRRSAELLRSSPASFAALWVLVFSLLIVLSPKSQGAYLGYLLLPSLVLCVSNVRALIVWVTAGAIAVVEPSLFYRLGEPHPAAWRDVQMPWGAVDLVLQASLVTMLVWSAWQTGKMIQTAVRGTATEVVVA